MPTKNASLFGALTLLISDVALLDAAYMPFRIEGKNIAPSPGVFPWLALTLATFALYRLFLRRERTLPQAAAFLAASYLVTAAVLLVFFVRLPSALSTAITVLFWAVPCWRIYTVTETAPTLEKLTLRLEVIIFVLLFVLLIIISTENPYIRALPCVASLLLCLASLIIMRTAQSGAGEGRGVRGVAVIFVFLLLIGTAVAAFLLFASASFGDTIAAGADALLRGIKYLFGLLSRFLLWLVSLFPEGDSGGDYPEGMNQPPPGIPDDMDMTIDGGETVLLVILCVLAASVAALVIVGVARFRHKKLGGKRMRKVARAKRRRRRAGPTFLQRLVNAARFYGYSIIYRNTPQGVFARLERWGKRRRRGRVLGETQRNYLTRLASDVPGQKTALMRLADALDAHWYGDPSLAQLSRGELASLRRSF
jgi:hypothetical protein